MRLRMVFIAILAVILLSPVKIVAAGMDEWVKTADLRLNYPQYVVGTNQKGKSNITEPRPVRSKYLDVDAGGIVIVKQGAGFFLKVGLIKELPARAYFKIEYPNPEDSSHPLVNDMEHNPQLGGYMFSSPDVIWGLKGYGDYFITVSVYAHKGDDEPIDVLKQKVRSYVDTQNNEVSIFKNVLKTLKK